MAVLRNLRDDRLSFGPFGVKRGDDGRVTDPGRRIRLGAKCDSEIDGAWPHQVTLTKDDEKALLGMSAVRALINDHAIEIR